MKFLKLAFSPFIAIRHLFSITGILLTVLFLTGCHSNNNKNGEQNKEGEGLHGGNVTGTYYKYFRGSIGERKAIIQLIRNQDSYQGILIDSAGRPLIISGQKDSSQQLTLISYEHYNPIDTFRGTFPQPGVFQGIQNDTAGNQNAFVFQEMYADGTHRWEAYSLNDSLAFDSARQSPVARVQMTLLWPDKKDMSDEQWSLLTDTIIKRYTGKDSIISVPDAVLKNASDTFFYHYQELKKDFSAKGREGIRATFNWESDADMQILWNANNLISLAFKSYQYTGGAHGLGNTFLTVFDLKENKVLTLNDVFKPGYQSRLQSVLEDKLRKEFDIPPNASLNGDDGILFDKQLALTKNFYLTGSGIGFIYNPYEVAPYVVGQIELYVPFSELQGILKDRG